MTQGVSIRGVVSRGWLDDTTILRRFLSMHEGKPVEISAREVRSTRSNQQNRLWWGCVVPEIVRLFRENGDDISPEEAHDYLKDEVLKLHRRVIGPDGRTAIVSGSTTKMTTTEFNDAIVKVQAWAAQFGGYIPDPNERSALPESLTKQKKLAP